MCVQLFRFRNFYMTLHDELQKLMTPRQREQATRIAAALLHDPTSLDNRKAQHLNVPNMVEDKAHGKG